MFIAKRLHNLNRFGKFMPSCGAQSYCIPASHGGQTSADQETTKSTRTNKKSLEQGKLMKKTISTRQLESAFNKYLYGPLLETKEEKNQRLEGKGSPELLSKYRQKKWYSYNKVDYERFAAIYSGNKVPVTAEKLPLKNEQNIPVKDQSKSFESSKAGVPSSNYEVLRNSTFQNVTCGTNYKNFDVSNKNGKEEGLETVNNPKYFDSPCFVNIHSCLTFPLFHDTSSVSQSNGSIFENGSPNSESAIVVDTNDEERKHNLIKKVPSVSHILSSTMSDASKAALAKWEKQMIAQLGVEGFQVYKKELFSQGTLLHRCIHTQLETHQPPSVEEEAQLKGLWPSVRNVVLEVEQEGKVEALESSVMHPYLHYGGIIDCIASYRGTPVVIEWKTSSKVKRTLRSTYDNPLQLAAYLGAVQFDPAFRHLREVHSGLIVLSYNSGEVGDTHMLPPAQLQHYWRQWLRRLATFWTLQRLETPLE